MKTTNFLILFLFFSLFSCKVQKKNKPLLTQIESNQPIILHINPEVKNFWMVEIPVEISLKNVTSQDYDLIIYNYYYGNKLQGNKPMLYELKNNNKKKFNLSHNNTIKKGSTLNLLLQTRHFIDTTAFSKSYFRNHSQKIDNTSDFDTIKIASLSHLKKVYPELFKDLLHSDSLSLKFYDGPKITMPVKH